MLAFSTAPSPTALALLPGATFADAFSIVVEQEGLDADRAARLVLTHSPRWMRALLALRNALVRPLGLKGTDTAAKSARDRIGFFPCISRSPERVVLGFDDRHLDFRIAVDLKTNPDTRQCVTATTIVKPHSLFGRAYLCGVMPFHKLIVPAMLKQLGKPT